MLETKAKAKSEITIPLNPTRKPNDPVWVIIDGDANGNISVSPDTFWLDPNEHVRWFCNLPHGEHGKDCFRITFQKPDLFGPANTVFHGHRSSTPVPHPNAEKGTEYKYTIEAPGFKTLDPQGGVKP